MSKLLPSKGHGLVGVGVTAQLALAGAQAADQDTRNGKKDQTQECLTQTIISFLYYVLFKNSLPIPRS